MADLRQTINRLQKGKDIESNLAIFSNSMMTTANRLSYIRFALNYPVLCEKMEDMKQGREIPKSIASVFEQLESLIGSYMTDSFSGQAFEESVKEVDTLRKNVTNLMQILSAYGDRFTIIEYVLNRIEYNFETMDMSGYSDEAMTNKIMEYLMTDKDNELVKAKTLQLIEQLPIRMSKAKFFQILEDGLSVYTGSDKKTVDGLTFMIRTVALLDEPVGFASAFPDLYEGLDLALLKDFKEIDGDSFKSKYNWVNTKIEILNNYLDFVVILEELVNDLYVIFLSTPYAMADLDERNTCQSIIFKVKENNSMDMESLLNNLTELFIALEGKQEHLYEAFTLGESVLDEIEETYKDMLPGLMLDKIYHSIRLMTMLLSNSIFIDLDDISSTNEKADQVYIRDVFTSLSKEMAKVFQENDKRVVRAIMAKVLVLLPLFLRSHNDLETYILNSLQSCSDHAEKCACIEIINGLMLE